MFCEVDIPIQQPYHSHHRNHIWNARWHILHLQTCRAFWLR
jgi:hypothetical protein